MKNNNIKVAMICSLLVISNTIDSQTIIEDKTDEFTKSTIRRTSWEVLTRTLKSEGYFRISQINDQYWFDLKLMLGSGSGKAFSINEGDKFMFLSEDDELIELVNQKYTLTCIGCGAKGLVGSNRLGIEISYHIDQICLDKLSKTHIRKVRIYTSLGYEEISLNEGQSKMIYDAVNLLFNQNLHSILINE